MSPPPQSLDRLREMLEDRARTRGRARPFWREILWLGEVASTQQTLSEMEQQGAPAGTVVIADAQTGGRGRRGRSWHSPRGLGLYLSALMRPGLAGGSAEAPPLLGRYSLVAALAAWESLRRGAGVEAEIKWPNDLITASGRKLGGLLIEARSPGGALRGVLVGLGVNLRHGEEDFPPEIAGEASSVAIERGGSGPDPAFMAAEFLDRLEAWSDRLAAEGPDRLLEAWRTASPSCEGRRIVVLDGAGRWSGTTAGLCADGALRVRADAGGTRELRLVEEISLREEGRCCS